MNRLSMLVLAAVVGCSAQVRGTDAGTDGSTCQTDADCSDGIGCTVDTCRVGGVCGHTTLDALCPTGETCVEAIGCTRPCTSDAECNDSIACTVDVCQVGGMCGHTPHDELCATGQTCFAGSGCLRKTCSTDADCQDTSFCNGAEVCTETGCQTATMLRDCNDNDTCTIDSCDSTLDMCAYMRKATPGCFDPTTAYSGDFTVSPALSQACSQGTAYNFAQIRFALLGPVLQVYVGPRFAPPFVLSQNPAPTGTMFDAIYQVTGDCVEQYELIGTFTDANHFTGTWIWDFIPCSAATPACAGYMGSCEFAALLDPACTSGSMPVSGTRL